MRKKNEQDSQTKKTSLLLVRVRKNERLKKRKSQRACIILRIQYEEMSA